METCIKYLSDINFMGVNESNVDISRELAKYSKEQEDFDTASRIREEYLDLRKKGIVRDHLLGETLKENVFDEIDNNRRNIIRGYIDTLKNLSETASSKLTYEFLSKYDASNFVLGKYCDCCAHIDGAGFSIMKASIVHPDCQNLIIRNAGGRVISKSTLYINRKEGYGILNTISVRGGIDKEGKKKIYAKYEQAISDFVSKYNEINKENPLKKINVGMGFNDLDKEVRINARKSKEILEGVDFSKYGGYEGDWKDQQYVFFDVDNVKRK